MSLLADAERYVSKGWKLVPLHGVIRPGKNAECTCKSGATCKSAGKHPRVNDWKNNTASTVEQVERWIANWSPLNVGILLGPDSGVIDIEFDTDEGRATAERLLSRCKTPTYISARSVHRLFLWSAELPDVQKMDIGGLEVRIGGGDRSTQSVLPPSMHNTGEQYRWLLDFGPDVEVERIPDSLFDHLYSHLYKHATENRTSVAEELSGGGTIRIGERNKTLYRGACSVARRLGAGCTSEIYQQVADWNGKCEEPLPEAELRRIVDSAVRFISTAPDPRPLRPQSPAASSCSAGSVTVAQSNGSAGGTQDRRITVTEPRSNFYLDYGLGYENDWWTPGNWMLTEVQADPIYYLLHIPKVAEQVNNGTDSIRIESEDLLNAKRVAQAVLDQTGRVMLNRRQALWANIWEGRGPERNVRGDSLVAQLLDQADSFDPDMSEKDYLRAAEYMLRHVLDALRGEPRSEPNEQAATHMEGGNVWLRWQPFWNDGLLSGTLVRADMRKLKWRLGLGRSDMIRWPHHPEAGQARLQYFVVTSHHIERLQNLISES